jgi:polysaccharide export outer membrane protein
MMRKSFTTTSGLILALVISTSGCANVNVTTPPLFASSMDAPYTLDSGDRLRIVVFGQNNLSASYTVDPAGLITLPLIGGVETRNKTTFEVQKDIEARLRNGYLREPNVSAEIETYRPFFILGEVQASGQYPFVAGMTAENAVAIANGFSPRAVESSVEVARKVRGQEVRAVVPLTTKLKPGDVVTVRERWF